MKHIVNFSGGWCSFFAAKRVAEKHGPLNTVLLFADTLIESPDLYEFNAQASAMLGIPITRVSLEIDPWELFRRQKMIGNNRFPICSVYLKRELLDAWMMEHFVMCRHERNFWLEEARLYVGFDWTEEHRLRDMREAHPSWDIFAPMTEGELWDKCRIQEEGVKLGFKLPELYALGFPHNNCGGRCVRAGISHWVHLFHVKRAAFEERETKEWETAEYLRSVGVEPLSVLKDRRGGETNNLYLRDLRARIESGEEFPKHDWGGCGCGGATMVAA